MLLAIGAVVLGLIGLGLGSRRLLVAVAVAGLLLVGLLAC